MDTAKQVTKSGDLNEFSMVLLNNTISLPLGTLLIIAFNETTFETAHLLAGHHTWWILGFGNKLHFHVISSSNRGYYIQIMSCSPVGSLNKIPLSVAGILLFHVMTSLENSASIFFGLLAGVFFAKSENQLDFEELRFGD